MAKAEPIALLPAGANALPALPLVIAVMTYLGLIAMAGALAFNAIAGGWTNELSRRVTVQVMALDPEVRAAQAAAVVRALRAEPSVAEAERLPDSAAKALLEPWLGTGNVSDDLPIPILVDVALTDPATADLSQLAAVVTKSAPGAQLDSHQRWMGQVSRFTHSLQTIANAVLLLVAVSVIAVVTLGVRAGLASQRDGIELLHLMGAEDDQIAREFQGRYLRHGLRGAAVGVIAGVLTLGLVLWLAPMPDGGGVTAFQFSWLAWLLLALTPVALIALVTVTARVAVRRALVVLL